MSYSVTIDPAARERFNNLKASIPAPVLAEFLLGHMRTLSPEKLRRVAHPIPGHLYACTIPHGESLVKLVVSCQVSHEKREIRIVDLGWLISSPDRE